MKLLILYYFLKFRFSRKFHANQPAKSMVRKWQQNLLKSPFYRQYIQNKKPFPIIDKKCFMEHFDEINTVHIKKAEALEVARKSELTRVFSPAINGISVGLSSGTSGNTGIFLTNQFEQAKWVGAVLDRVIGFTFRKRMVAFFLRANNNLYESVNSSILKFNFFDIKEPIKGHLEKLATLKPDILVAQPSVLLEIARYYDQKKITPSYQKIISVAEVLEYDHYAYFKEVFQCRVIQVYQCTEGFLAHTCKEGYLHFNEDWLKIEKKYLDDSNTRFHPIITDYLRISQPIVRYELNDIIHERKNCTCGLSSTAIEKIEGRSDDVFRFVNSKGQLVTIYPDFIRRAIIVSSENILNYVVAKIEEKTIAVHLELKDQDHTKSEVEFDQVRKALEALLESYAINDINIIYRPYQHHHMQKFKRIKNDYSKNIQH